MHTLARMKALFLALLVVHGLIHLIGFVKGFGLAPVETLHQPISRAAGAVWLAAAVLFVASAVVRVAAPSAFFVVAAVAVVLSQVVIVRSWSDARFGTIANLIVLVPIALALADLRVTRVVPEARSDGQPLSLRCPPEPDVATAARDVAAALVRRREPACVLPTRAAPHVEVHLKLAETDEREVATLSSVLTDVAKWPSVVADELTRCFGDCCDFRVSGLEPRKLHLRRVCFAAREDARRKISLVTFAEAR